MGSIPLGGRVCDFLWVLLAYVGRLPFDVRGFSFATNARPTSHERGKRSEKSSKASHAAAARLHHPDRDVKGGDDASRGGGEAADASLPRLSRLWSRCSAPSRTAARAHMRGSLVAQPALPLSAQALMREVETRLPGLGFMMIPVGLVAGHPEKQAVTPKVMSAALSPCASPAAFLLRNRL